MMILATSDKEMMIVWGTEIDQLIFFRIFSVMQMSTNEETKEKIRREIWGKMEKLNIATFPRPVFGRIPNFIGAEKAAKKLRELPEWKQAKMIFINPDSPQRPVRTFALMDGKKVVVSSPRIKKGFLLLDPDRIPRNKYWEAATIRGAFRYGRKIHPSEVKIDMKVTGSVAVDRKGGRIGKGHGYSDIEYGILKEYGAITDKTPIVTTVHDIQVVEKIPVAHHDMPVDIIVTPTRVIRTNTAYKKPPGILWDKVDARMMNEIPLLKELINRKNKI